MDEGGAKFFTHQEIEGTQVLVLGTADFVTRPIIVMAQDEIVNYVQTYQPARLVIDFANVHRISSEFLNAMIQIRDHVLGNGGMLKLSQVKDTVRSAFRITHLEGRVFEIYESTPQAIDAF